VWRKENAGKAAEHSYYGQAVEELNKMKKHVTVILAFLFCIRAHAQSIKQVNDSISYYKDRIEENSPYNNGSDGNSDSLYFYNEALKHYLLSALIKQPLTLQTIFRNIATSSSDDKKFRIYWWDDQSGGTMHGYYSMVQYQTSNGVKAEVIYPKDGASRDVAEDKDAPGFFYTRVHTVKTVSNKIFYLVIRNGRYMTWDVSSGIKAFSIDNDRLVDTVGIFKTSKEILNSIDYEYDYFSNYDTKTNKEKYQIRLSSDKKKLYIPVVVDLKVTNRNLVYLFDGNNYVFDKHLK